jgi:fatty-acyl-CoA synthase
VVRGARAGPSAGGGASGARHRYGSRVGLLADTSIDLVSVLQGVWLAGAAVTVLPLPVTPAAAEAPRTRPNSTGWSRTPACTSWSSTRLRPGRTGYGPLRTVGPILAKTVAPCTTSPTSSPARVDRTRTACVAAPDDLAILQYTSGSTRDPRGVAVTHANLAANLAGIPGGDPARTDGTAARWAWLPLYTTWGSIGYLALQMSCGCPLVMQSPATFAARQQAGWKRSPPTAPPSTAAPNFAWRSPPACWRPGRPPTRRRSWVRYGSRSVAANRSIRGRGAAAGRRRRHGLDPAAVTCGYGLAEATLAVTFPAPGRAAGGRGRPGRLEHTGRRARPETPAAR